MAKDRIRRPGVKAEGVATFARTRIRIDRPERLRRPAAVAARWAHRICFAAAVLLLAGAAEIFALWLLVH